MSLIEIVQREMTGLVQLSDAQLARLQAHYELLLAWNQRLSLTTVTTLPEAATRHYCESLFLSCHLSPGSVADIGSGPGFPGIPCAVVREDCQFDLIESHQRKSVFLKEATRGWTNVRVRAMRAEALTDRYDWVVSRAVDPMEVLALGTTKGARPAIARNFALLIGAEDAARIANCQVIPLPWGTHRVLAIVSRGTESGKA